METTVMNKGRGKRPWRWIVPLIAIGAVLLALVGFSRSRSQAALASQAQTGKIVEAFTGDLAASATASGQVEPQSSARLAVASPGVVNEVLVREGDEVAEGDVLMRLDARDLVLKVERASQNVTLSEANLQALLEGSTTEDIAAAEAAVQSARTNLDDLRAGPTAEEIAEAEANVRQQQANVNSAAASYNSTRDSVSAESIASAEADLVSAQIAYDHAKEANDKFAISFTDEALVEARRNLEIVQAKVDELNAGPKQGSLENASANISTANANLEKAMADLDKLLAGPTEAQIKAAESTLAQAEAKLADLTAGAKETELAKARAELEQAKLDLASAREALTDAEITAPFAGLVSSVLVSPGERATGNVIELVSSALKVVLNVDEVDVGALRVGQPATITLETWRDRSLPGEIAAIAPSAVDTSDGIVSYDVTVTFDPQDLPVLAGMTADARLITAERSGVLLVPNSAITADRAAGTYTVNRVTGEVDGVPQTELVQVTLGLRDDSFTQVTSGLAPGDRVVVGELSAPTIDFGGPGPFGGGDQESAE